jgi:hypothetical protein
MGIQDLVRRAPGGITIGRDHSMKENPTKGSEWARRVSVKIVGIRRNSVYHRHLADWAEADETSMYLDALTLV